MRKVWITLLIVSLTCLWSGAALADDLADVKKKGEIRLAMSGQYPPFNFVDENNQLTGFDVEMGSEVAKRIGIKAMPLSTAWDGIIPALITEKFDIIISGMTVTQERNLKINFCDPYIIVGQTILIQKKHEGIINSYNDLNNPKYTVTSKLGTTGEMAVKRMIPKCNYKSFETEPEAALEVVNGKADAFVYDLPYCVVFMAQQGAGKLVFLDQPFTYEPLAWATRKGDPDLLNWLNNFLTQIKNDGRYARIYNKWIKSTDWIINVQ